MGNELRGAVRVGKNRHAGKILLETSELLFRGDGLRLKIPFGEIRRVSADNDELQITTRDGLTVFEVGAAADKWRDKILHPKSRAEKLGVKASMKIRLVGAFAKDFLQELKFGKAAITDAGPSSARPAMTFLSVEGGGSAEIAKEAKRLQGDQVLWVVYPKGKKELTENDVINAGRKARLKDVKVVGFSGTHTALKFVIPLDRR